jgi:putative hydrolase of the HAD superfamily
MSKRAILFDFGGVFMKTVDYTPRHTWDDRLGLTHGSVEHIVHGSESWRAAQTGQMSISDYWADVAQQLGLDQNDIATLANDYFSGDELDLELVEYTRHLRAKGHAVALLSNDSFALTDKLSKLGIADLFDPLIISAQIGVMKPDSRAFQTALDRLKRPAEAVIFIDDIPANIEGARKLGIHSIHYTTTMALQTALEPLLEMKE